MIPITTTILIFVGGLCLTSIFLNFTYLFYRSRIALVPEKTFSESIMDLLSRGSNEEVDSKYELEFNVSSGPAVSLYRGFRKEDKTPVFCKIHKCQNRADLAKVTNELNVWKAVSSNAENNSKNIAEFWYDISHEVRMYVISGYSAQGLIDKITKSDRPAVLFPFVAFRIAHAVARGVKSCHDKNVLHLNVKPTSIILENPFEGNSLCWRAAQREPLLPKDGETYEAMTKFLSKNQSSSIVLSNFSSAMIIDTEDKIAAPSHIGWHMAPESNEGKFSKKSDIYSLGSVLYEIFSCRRLPTPLDLRFMKIPKEYPDQLRELISECISIDANSRPDIDAVIATLTECSTIVESGELGMDGIQKYIEAELDRLNNRSDFPQEGRDFRTEDELVILEGKGGVVETLKSVESEEDLPELATQMSEKIRSRPGLEAGQQPSYKAQRTVERRKQARSDELWHTKQWR